MNIDREHKRLEIGKQAPVLSALLTRPSGTTWYTRKSWGTHVNPSSKFLLLQYAFEVLHFNRVSFRTDVRNTRSRANIKKLGELGDAFSNLACNPDSTGAKEEGVMRAHMIVPIANSERFRVRDTIQFAITASDWFGGVAEDLKRRVKSFSNGS